MKINQEKQIRRETKEHIKAETSKWKILISFSAVILAEEIYITSNRS